MAHLLGSAEVWYDTIKSTRGPITIWQAFSDAFLYEFIPIAVRSRKINELFTLVQGRESVLEFTYKFDELCRFAGDVMKDEFSKGSKYEAALRPEIRAALGGTPAPDYATAIERAINTEENLMSLR
ncbi:UNVERIFIED_CONTAM: retrotransposon gag domain-containing protein, partial [Salmonella enterica subsp. enterica serovar Weltevreden]